MPDYPHIERYHAELTQLIEFGGSAKDEWAMLGLSQWADEAEDPEWEAAWSDAAKEPDRV